MIALAPLLASRFAQPALRASAKVGLTCALCLGFTAVGWGMHDRAVYRPHLKKDAQMALRAEIAGRRIEQASSQIAQEARDLNDTKQETIRVVTRETLKAIPYYVPQEARMAELLPVSSVSGAGQGLGEGDSAGSSRGRTIALSLPVGFGRLHDYAALGVDPPVPAPSGEPLSASSGIGLPGLAHTIVSNYGVCRADWQEVEAWRGWYRKQSEAWPKP